jgi:hypothetical protein
VKIDDAPGLVIRMHKKGWKCLWRARADIIAKGFKPKSEQVWLGQEPTAAEIAQIQDACRRLQDEMLAFGRGTQFEMDAFDGTLGSLIRCYQTDPQSTYHKLRFHTRVNHNGNYRRIIEAYGHTALKDINGRLLLAWHKEWSEDGKYVSAGHSFIARLRTLCTFGFTMLDDVESERVGNVLGKMRFPNTRPRTVVLTAQHAEAIRAKARDMAYFSIALAQALQFELMLRQKDVIGEYVPISDPGLSDFVSKNKNHGKWLRGLRWSEIDENLILRHETSKKGKTLVVDLKLAPMVMDEIKFIKEYYGEIPTSGPVVIAEGTGEPWHASEFRRQWRRLATFAGVPKGVTNMDSRAGAISEATAAGADLEHVKHAATHSDISMTQRYSRQGEEKIAKVQLARIEERKNKNRTE